MWCNLFRYHRQQLLAAPCIRLQGPAVAPSPSCLSSQRAQWRAHVSLQVDKVSYEMKPTEVEIITWELQDYEETITVSELQEVEEEVEVRLPHCHLLFP